MGHRMSDVPPIYGDNCGRWPNPDQTPKYLYVRFSQVVKCPDIPPTVFETPPNDRVFKLTQDEFVACLWEITTGGWHIIVDLWNFPGRVVLWLEFLPVGDVYFYDTPVMVIDEGFVYSNLILDCLLGDAASGGIATVTWTPEATTLLEALNMKQADDLFMEMRPMVGGDKAYKFCRLQDATNIAIRLTPP